MAALASITNVVDQVFERYDRNRNGYLDLDETREFIKDTLADLGSANEFSEEAF